MERLITLLVLLLPLTAKGQDGQSRFFADGRSWRYEYIVPDYEHMTEEQKLNGNYGWLHESYVLSVVGDTIADGRSCRKIMADGPWGTYLYALGLEDGDKVLLRVLQEEPAFCAPFSVDKWVTLYDFGAEKGAWCQMQAFLGGDVTVSGVGHVDVADKSRRFLVISKGNEGLTDSYAVDGIGCPMGLYMFVNIIDNGSASTFKGCYDGEDCIFSCEDFGKLPEIDATDSYEPFIREGKVWNVLFHNPFTGEEYETRLTMNGDTVVNNHTCKKVYEDDASQVKALLYETDKKVYRIWPGCEASELLYDFGCNVGDVVSLHGYNVLVTAVDTVEQHGRMLRRIVFVANYYGSSDESFEATEYCWVEGVGSSADMLSNIELLGNYYSFQSCMLNGQMLYDNTVFYADAVHADIRANQEVQARRWHSVQRYDLQGRRLNAQPSHGVYIRDGRKYVR